MLRRPLRDDGQGLETPIDDARWIAVEFWLRVGPTLPPGTVQQLVQRHNHPLLVLAATAPARPRAPVHLLPIARAAPDVHIMTASFAEVLDSMRGADVATAGVPVLVRTQRMGLHAEMDPLAWWPGASRPDGGSSAAASPVHTAELVVPAAAPAPASLDAAVASTSGGANGKASPPPPEWPVMLDDCHWRDVFARSSCGRVLGWRGVGAYLVMAAVPLLGMLLAIMLTIPRVRLPKRHLD